MEVRLRPVSSTTSGPGLVEKFADKARIITVLGYIQIAVGILCIINAVLCISLETAFADTGYGIWCGIVFALAGGLGIAAVKTKTKCLIITFTILCVIAAIMLVPVVILTAANEFRNDAKVHWVQHTEQQGGKPVTYWKTVDPGGLAIKKALHVFMIMLGLIEGIVAVMSAILCCGIVCGGRLGESASQIERGGSVTYQLLLTVPHQTSASIESDTKNVREAILTFPEPPPAPEPDTQPVPPAPEPDAQAEPPAPSDKAEEEEKEDEEKQLESHEGEKKEEDKPEEEGKVGEEERKPPLATKEVDYIDNDAAIATLPEQLDDAMKSSDTKPKPHITI